MEVVKNWEEEATGQPNYEIDLNERMKVSVMKTGLLIWWSIIQGKTFGKNSDETIFIILYQVWQLNIYVSNSIQIDLMNTQYQNEVLLDGNQVNEGFELQVKQTY